MDCEKFDQIIIDAVYDELDELTLAAAKRHADGCQHCQTALAGLRATRKIGLLPLVEAPAGIEAHVLQAAREAHRTLPWPKRVGRAISWAGSYAMRPQTAMAALLLLMLGSSLILVRANPDRSGGLSRVNVIERGVPRQPIDEPHVDRPGRLEERPAASARTARRDDDRGIGSPSAAMAAPTATNAAEPGRIAEGEAFGSKGGASKAETDMVQRSRSAPAVPAAAPAPPNEMAQGVAADRSTAASEKKKDQQGPAAPGGFATPPAGQAQDAFAAATDLFNAARFAEAEKAFDEIAATDSKDAARAQLYAARAADRGFGCGKALPKYEQVYARYGSSATGPDGLMGAADCYATLGNYDQALANYNRLRSIAGYRATAEDKINTLPMLRQQQMAAKRSAPAKAAAPPAAAKPKSSTSTEVMK